MVALVSTIILKGHKFVNTELRINWRLQTQVVPYTPSRLLKYHYSWKFSNLI